MGDEDLPFAEGLDGAEDEGEVDGVVEDDVVISKIRLRKSTSLVESL